MAHILIKVKLSSLQSTSSKYRQLTPCTESYMGWFQQKKKPEIAVIFLHSSLTAQNWAIISNLTAPLSLGQVIRTIMTSIIIITILNLDAADIITPLHRFSKLGAIRSC